MTNERQQAIAEYLAKDMEKAEKLLNMNVEEAQKQICDDGFDVTADELKEFASEAADALEKQNSNELNADELDNVSGGIAMATLGAIWFASTCSACAASIGKTLLKRGWK